MDRKEFEDKYGRTPEDALKLAKWQLQQTQELIDLIEGIINGRTNTQ